MGQHDERRVPKEIVFDVIYIVIFKIMWKGVRQERTPIKFHFSCMTLIRLGYSVDHGQT